MTIIDTNAMTEEQIEAATEKEYSKVESRMLIINHHRNRYQLDGETNCVKAETAIHRIFKGIDVEKMPEYKTMEAAMIECIQADIWSDTTGDSAVTWGVDFVGDDEQPRWYVYCNVDFENQEEETKETVTMTKTERINAMVNKSYSLIGRKAVANVVTGKITVDFMGEFEGKQVKMSFHCSNRIQVAALLKRFRVDANELMTWVKFVVISNVNRGPVKNSKGEWKSRPRVLEFRVKSQPTPEAPQPEAPAPIAANVQEDTTEASVSTYTTEQAAEPTVVTKAEEKAPAKATKKIKINGQTIVIADEWIDLKWIRVNWYTREYFERNQGMRRNRKFEVSRQAMWDYIQRENAAKEPKMDMQLFSSKEPENNITKPKARMTINQLEELIAKMKYAIEKKSCSSTVQISIDQQGTITFNQQSGYQECVGEFYTYNKNR